MRSHLASVQSASLAYITRDTRVIAIITPDEKVPPGLTPDELTEWRNWRTWRVSVDDIEAETGLNLLSNISQEIQDYLEARLDTLSALMVEDNRNSEATGLFLHPSGFIKEHAIVPKGFEEEGPRSRVEQVYSFPEIIRDEHNFNVNASPIKVSFSEDSSGQNTFIQTGVREICFCANGSTQISPIQISMGQISISQVSSDKLSSTQVSVTEIGAAQINTNQFSSTQINLPQVSIFHRHSIDRNINEITLYSSIVSQQISSFYQSPFDGHNSNPQLTNFYSTTQTRMAL